MLQPKRVKYRNHHRGRRKGLSNAGSTLNFGEFGLKATENGPNKVKNGLAICTALAPIIGYDNAANIAHIASKTGESIFEVAIKETDLSKEELEKILDPEAMTEPKK